MVAVGLLSLGATLLDGLARCTIASSSFTSVLFGSNTSATLSSNSDEEKEVQQTVQVSPGQTHQASIADFSRSFSVLMLFALEKPRPS